MPMRTSEAILLFGSGRKLAKALGISPKAVYQWNENVPVQRASQIREKYAIRLNEHLTSLKKMIEEVGQVGIEPAQA